MARFVDMPISVETVGEGRLTMISPTLSLFLFSTFGWVLWNLQLPESRVDNSDAVSISIGDSRSFRRIPLKSLAQTLNFKFAKPLLERPTFGQRFDPETARRVV